MFLHPVNNIVILEQQRPLFGNRQQFTIYQLMPPGDSILNVNITIRMVCSTCDSVSTFSSPFITYVCTTVGVGDMVHVELPCHRPYPGRSRRKSPWEAFLISTSASHSVCHQKECRYKQIFWFAFITMWSHNHWLPGCGSPDTRFSRLNCGLCSTNSF